MAVANKMKAGYMECSAKEMIGVDEIFLRAINTVVANDPSNQVQQPSSRSKNGPSDDGIVRKKKKKAMCRIL
jgi:Ras family protein A